VATDSKSERPAFEWARGVVVPAQRPLAVVSLYDDFRIWIEHLCRDPMIASGNAGFNPAVDLVFNPTNSTLADGNAFRKCSIRHAFINSAAALSGPALDFSTPNKSLGHCAHRL